MTKGHGTAAVVIGTLQLIVAGGLIIASFVFGSYGSISTSQTPWWGGFPVSIQTPVPLIILLAASRFKLNSRHFFHLLVHDVVRNTLPHGLFMITRIERFFRVCNCVPSASCRLHGRLLISFNQYV